MNARCAICGSIEELSECYTKCNKCSHSYCIGCFTLNARGGRVRISEEKCEKRVNNIIMTTLQIDGPCLKCPGRESELETAKMTALQRRRGYRGCYVCRNAIGGGFYCKDCDRKLCQVCADRYVREECPFCADDEQADKIIDNMLSMMVFNGQVENIVGLAGQKIDDVLAAAKANITTRKRPAD